MSSKLEPMIWLRVLVALAYIKGRTDVLRTDVHDVIAIKTKFSHIDGLPYFLNFMMYKNQWWCSVMPVNMG